MEGSNMDVTLVVGNIALVCTIASNFSGLPICVDFFKKRSTSNVSALPFFAGATCTSLWLQYSIITGNPMLQTVNAIAVIMQTIYVASFYVNTAQKKKTGFTSLFIIVFLLLVYMYGFHMTNQATGTEAIGYLAAVGSILACAAPLSTVMQVISTRSSETLPFPIIFSSFVVTGLWYLYGILVEDGFIQIPNLIGAVLSGLQLCLIAMFPAKKEKEL